MLFGNTVRLRALERSDIHTFVRWFNDPDVREGLLLYAPMSLAMEEIWFDNLLKSSDYIFGIEATNSSTGPLLIGNVGLHDVDHRHARCKIGLVIGDKSFWGKGYGGDAMSTMIRFAFRELNIHRIELEVFSTNLRAKALYEKLGFKMEGVRRECVFSGGKYIDGIQMSLLRGELE